VANDKTDGLSLDGYRVLTFLVQESNDSSGEVRYGEGKINFLFSFSYLGEATLHSAEEIGDSVCEKFGTCRGLCFELVETLLEGKLWL
jgi:hypothetical protein